MEAGSIKCFFAFRRHESLKLKNGLKSFSLGFRRT